MYKSRLYQHGTLALLVPGLLKGTLSISDLLKKGDVGIGTGEGLDGEIIILDGTPYQANYDGNVNLAPQNLTLPFADTHYSNYKFLTKENSLSMKELNQKIVSLLKSKNLFFSIKIIGDFSMVSTRVVKKSHEPFETLSEAANNQKVFSKREVEGTVVGYYSPKEFDGISVSGFHNHFLSNNLKFGGHILDFYLISGEVYYQIFETFEQHFPINNKDYIEHDFDKDEIINSVHHAEGSDK